MRNLKHTEGIFLKKLYNLLSKKPQQKLPAQKGRVIIQNRYFDKTENKEMLLRVIGLETSDEFKVITLYKTSKINKYWINGG